MKNEALSTRNSLKEPKETAGTRSECAGYTTHIQKHLVAKISLQILQTYFQRVS